MEGIYGINYDGVKKRPTFEELIDYKEPKITYPDRSALFTRESPLMTQFDNIGAMELEDQQRREVRERMREDMLRHIASSSQFTMQELRSMSPQIFRMDIDDDTRTPMTFPITNIFDDDTRTPMTFPITNIFDDDTRTPMTFPITNIFDDAYISLDEEVTKRISDDVDKQNTAIALAQAELYATHGGSRSSQLMQRAGEIVERLPPRDDVVQLGAAAAAAESESESDKDVSGAAASSSKPDPVEEDKPGAVQTGASSSSAVEEAKKLFIGEREKGKRSKYTPTEDEMPALLAREFTIVDRPQLNELDITVLRRIAKHKGIQISSSGSGYKTRDELISAITRT